MRSAWSNGLVLACLVLAIGVMLCLAAAFWTIRSGGASYIATRYMIEQDAGPLLLTALLVALWPLLSRRLPGRAEGASGLLGPGVAAFIALAWAGSHLIFAGYALSADEWWASVEGAHYRQGIPFVPLAEDWRGYAAALTPSYVVTSQGQTLWGSMYLPVNASLQALLPAGAASAAMAGSSLLLLRAVARALVPDLPVFAAVAVLLLVGSSQFVVTAMTPYAMSAHLAANLLWLVLVLRRSLAGHVLAAFTAFLAIGLHQPVFFPLFAAPFVLSMWTQRDYAPALWHSAVLAVALLVWTNWLALAMGFMGGALPQGSGAGWSRGPLDVALQMWAKIDAHDIGTMAQNLLRLLTWTHPLMLLLAICGAGAAWRAGGALRSLLGGVVLTFAVVALLSPHQGHGWGYRYLHGLLGNLSLIGALGYARLRDGIDAVARRKLYSGFLAVTALSLAVLLPLRLWQAHVFVAPYAAADAAIAATDADFVVVSDDRHAFSTDLVRNDPLLRNRPLRFDANVLTQAQLDTLCIRGRVVQFDAASAGQFGIGEIAVRPIALRWPHGCGTARVGG